ncbi:pilus assembly protein PilZ [Methylobacterium sp. A54F]
MDAERRISTRRDAFQIGRVCPGGGAPESECLIWDASDDGARIEVDRPEALPDAFVLTATPFARPRACRVVRRDGRDLALAFTD